MEAIRNIKNKDELDGTAYVELLPGAYRNQCWNKNSLFFEEEIFGYLEKIISRHAPSYDHYAFTEIDKETFSKIVLDFKETLHKSTQLQLKPATWLIKYKA